MSFRDKFESHVEESMKLRLARNPTILRFHQGEWMDAEFYKRHVLETALRINLNNEVDAYALYKIGYKDDRLAKVLARYLAEEYCHVEFFLSDLERLGMSRSDIENAQVFHSTDKLIGYMYHRINADGPLPTMIWNWIVEWYSDRYNGVITEAASKEFGAEKVKGSRAHISFDEAHDHDDLMWSAVEQATERWGGQEKALEYISVFVDLIGEYFDELYANTVGQRLSKAS